MSLTTRKFVSKCRVTLTLVPLIYPYSVQAEQLACLQEAVYSSLCKDTLQESLRSLSPTTSARLHQLPDWIATDVDALVRCAVNRIEDPGELELSIDAV